MSGHLTLVIPSWNDDDRLRATLSKYTREFHAVGVAVELIVVSDGSNGKTQAVVDALGDESVRLLQFPVRVGKGGALLAGARIAQGEHIGFIDADGPVDGLELLHLAGLLSESDCVIGSRWLPGSRVTQPQPAFRRVASRAWNALVRVWLGLPYKDTQCGVKFFRKPILLSIVPLIRETGWAFDVELLYRLRGAGGSVQEVPITWTNGDESKLSVWRSWFPMLLALLATRAPPRPFRSDPLPTPILHVVSSSTRAPATMPRPSATPVPYPNWPTEQLTCKSD